VWQLTDKNLKFVVFIGGITWCLKLFNDCERIYYFAAKWFMVKLVEDNTKRMYAFCPGAVSVMSV